jgi:hypothetical protein
MTSSSDTQAQAVEAYRIAVRTVATTLWHRRCSTHL